MFTAVRASVSFTDAESPPRAVIVPTRNIPDVRAPATCPMMASTRLGLEMKNVLLLIHDDAGQEARLQVALDLTRGLSGHLHCLDVTPLPLFAEPAYSMTVPLIVADETEQESRNRAQLRERLEVEDVAWSWEDVRGEFADCLVSAARTADMIVVNRKLDEFPQPDMAAIVHDVILHSEALVVAPSEACRSFPVTAPALIAWDGSGTAMRTVQRAVPLLQLASSVQIHQVGALAEDEIPAEDVAAYLSRHGIKPAVVISPSGGATADLLCAAIDRLGAGYCVMGGFGHRRLRDVLFGSVTREMLGCARVPLVLGH